MTSTVIATRGQRLTLIRANFSDRDRGPEAFHSEILALGEINADERITAVRTLLAEESRMGMMIGVTVGWVLNEELSKPDETEGDE